MPVMSFLVFAFVTSFTPGPNNILSMVFANQYGFKKTIRFCIGVGTGFFAIILLSCYFNLLLKNFIPKIEWVMTIIGTAYMLYLAFKIMTSQNSNKNQGGGKNNNLFTGVLLQFVNPKGILFGITVTSTFIIPYYTSSFSFIFFALFLGLVGFAATSSWCAFGTLFQKFLSKYRKPFNVVMALLLVYSAYSILME